MKLTFNENTINELVSFFKLKTSFDLFYRIGTGSIENNQLKEFVAQRSNAFLNFFKKNRKDGHSDIFSQLFFTF